MGRTIDIDAEWDGDEETPGRYLRQLANALWRHQEIENWATLGAVIIACEAVRGDPKARHDLDNNPAWDLDSAFERRLRGETV